MNRIFAFIMMTMLGLCACSGGSGTDNTKAAEAARQGILLVGNGAEPPDLDPHVIHGHPEIRISRAMFEGLVTFKRENLNLAPAAAASWDISEDGKVYTFHLREDAKWSNGEPVTAHDFVYAWKRALTPSLAGQYAYILYCVKNGKSYYNGEIDDPDKIGVKALDDYTFEVTLAQPTAHFLSMLVLPVTFPVHPPTIEKFGSIGDRNTKWTRPGNLVSNGPFQLKAWEPNQVLEVVRNPHYWDAETVRLNEIHFFPIPSLQTEERMFRTGDLHITYTIPITKIDIYRNNNDERLQIDPYFGTYYYKFNTTQEPFDDRLVRLAFAMSIDRESIVRDVMRGGQQPAPLFTPPLEGEYVSRSGISYDVEKARELLAEAGYPDGEGFPPMELLYNTQEAHRVVAEAIQNMWQNALNVQVDLINQDWKVYLSNMNNLDYNVARAGWIGDYVDPSNFLDTMRSDSGNNNAGWKNEEYDRLLDEAARTLDEQKRNELLQQAEAILLEEAPVAPIYFYTETYLQSPMLKGKTKNILGYWFFKHMYLEPPPLSD